MAIEQAAPTQELQAPDKLTAEQLDLAVDAVTPDDLGNPSEVPIPNELLEQITTEEEPKEKPDEPKKEDENVALEQTVETETEVPEYLKETPFKNNDEIVKGYKNLTELLAKQASELGDFRALRNAPAPQPAPENLPQPQSNQNGEYDPYDKGAVATMIQNAVNAAVSPLQAKLDVSTQSMANQSAAAEEQVWRTQADKLGERFPEFKVQGNMNEVLNVIHECRSKGIDPSTINPEAAKVQKIADLITSVKNSNGMFQTLADAHTWDMVKGDGLSQLLLDKKKVTAKATVIKLNNNNAGAQTLTKVGGSAPVKTLQNVNQAELDKLVDLVSEQEQEEFEDRRF